METIREKFIDFCKKEGVGIKQLEEDTLVIGCQGENATYITQVDFVVQSQAVVIHTRFPLSTPKEKREELLWLINRFNLNLTMGCFVYDTEDDLLMFRTSATGDESAFDDQLIYTILFGNWTVIDKKFPEIARLILRVRNLPKITPRNKTGDSSKPSHTNPNEGNGLQTRNRFSGFDDNINQN